MVERSLISHLMLYIPRQVICRIFLQTRETITKKVPPVAIPILDLKVFTSDLADEVSVQQSTATTLISNGRGSASNLPKRSNISPVDRIALEPAGATVRPYQCLMNAILICCQLIHNFRPRYKRVNFFPCHLVYPLHHVIG